jgi:hypothetical protein
VRILLAEWTKLRSVLGTTGCVLAAVGSIVAAALLISSGSPGTYSENEYIDEFHLVHRPLTGDGSIQARVSNHDGANPWAMAGVIIKQGTDPGAPYAALPVTAGHGVRMLSNFTVDIAGADRAAPYHVRLTRAGDTITGYGSVDGSTWTTVGSVTLAGMPATVEAGLFVTSPGMTRIHPMRPALARIRPSTATFDSVRLDPTTPQPDVPWRAVDVGRANGLSTIDGDAFELIGSGDIVGRADDGSRIVAATAGTVFAVLPAIALGCLAVTAEYRWRIIWNTLLASPRRGLVFGAKAAVVGGVTFLAGLATTLTALLLTQPLLRRNGYRPPVYPDPDLLDATTVRVVAGTAAFLTLLTLVSLGVGALLRRTAAAISVVAAAVFVPVVVTPLLPGTAATWLQRISPLAGMSIQQVRETDDVLLLPWAGRPWAGLAVLGGYAVVALAAGYLRLSSRDA